MLPWIICTVLCFFFNDTATTEIYTLSLHDALPIFHASRSSGERSLSTSLFHLCGYRGLLERRGCAFASSSPKEASVRDRKSTRLNSSHANISYAVFCLKKKNTHKVVLRIHPTHCPG